MKPLDRAIFAFRSAVEGTEVPLAVFAIMEAVRLAIPAEKPAVALNRSLGQLRRQHPGLYLSLNDWLALDEVKNLASKAGAYWAWVKWCEACELLLKGEKASVAFGMDSPGKPRRLSFSRYEDAALLAEHRSIYVPSEMATRSTVENDDGNELDRREIQRHRAVVRSFNLSDDELKEQARIICMKSKS